MNVSILVYTPGLLTVPHFFDPKLTIPIWNHGFASPPTVPSWYDAGPPESPPHESFPEINKVKHCDKSHWDYASNDIIFVMSKNNLYLERTF